MKTRKIKIYCRVPYYTKWVKNAENTDNVSDADIVMFPGGADVNPKLYGCENVGSYVNEADDQEDISVWEQIDHKKQLVVGICKGAQFATAMSGGKLIQDVTNHATLDGHKIKFDTLFPVDGVDEDHSIFKITSTHHQMMYPFSLKSQDFDIIAQSFPPLSDYYIGDKTDNPICEPEIVWYHNTNSLAIQGHPEMMNENDPVIDILNNLVIKKLNDLK